jgi:hypothetical protein
LQEEPEQPAADTSSTVVGINATTITRVAQIIQYNNRPFLEFMYYTS